MTQPANLGDILALGRFRHAPIEMEFALPFRGDAARSHFESGSAEVPDQVIALGRNVPVIEIDQHDLRLDDILRFRLAGRRHRARHDKEGHAGVRRPDRLNRKLGRQVIVRFDEGRMRRPIERPFLGKGSHRHPAIAIAKDDIGIGRDGGSVWNDRGRRRHDVLCHHAQHRCFQAQ